MAVLMLLTGVTGNLLAQQTQTNEEKTFEIPLPTSRRFYIDLDKGNRLQIDVSNLEDLDRFKNMDSVIYGLLQDLKLLKDSLSDETTTKRIDYVMDDTEKRKVRVIQYRSKGAGFLITDNGVSGLKTEQDTVNFIGKVVYEAKYTLRPRFTDTRYYKISLFVNNLTDLAAYMNGTLNEKIISVQKNANTKWESIGRQKKFSPIADPSIHANAVRGYMSGGDFLELKLSVDVQNYKNYFVPSATIGLNLVLANKNFKHEIGVASESHFSFARNNGGELKTFHSQFLTLSLAHGPIRDNDPGKESYQLFNMTFGYLIRSRGSVYEKNTMRLGVGTLSLFEGKTKIQPMIYYTNLFRGVTPGIRWVQSF